MEIAVPVKKENLNKAKLLLLRRFLNNITDLEATIISEMLNKKILVLDRDTKPLLMQSLNIGVHNFNNNVKRLADKGILYIPQGSKTWTLNSKILQITKDNSITIEFQPHE